jgi:hypothetical protein
MITTNMDVDLPTTLDRQPGSPPRSRPKPIEICEREFREKFNRQHFLLRHHLADAPEFSLPRLVQLARDTQATRPDDVYLDIGVDDVGKRWDEAARSALPVDELIRRIEEEQAWIVLFRAEQDPAYARLLNGVLSEVMQLTGREIERTIKKKEVILFVTSPNRLTTYHIDRECNFLLQIQGSKEIHVFDRDDREVLPEAEVERFWTVDHNAPRYRPEYQHRAERIMLEPGIGLHIPINAPHWLQNGNNVSVSASFNFQFRDDVRANLYRGNYYLRRVGLKPRPPFQSRRADVVRGAFGACAFRVKTLVQGRQRHD